MRQQQDLLKKYSRLSLFVKLSLLRENMADIRPASTVWPNLISQLLAHGSIPCQVQAGKQHQTHSIHNTKYLAIALCASYLTYTKKKTIIPLCSFLSFLDRACLCLNSFSAPDAFLDILSPEIIRSSLPADIRAEPVSDAALSGGT